MRRHHLLFGLLAGFLLSAGCRENTAGPSAQVATVLVAPGGDTIGVGQTADFRAEAVDASNATLTAKSFVFSSSNTAVATVADPLANPATFIAVAAGSAMITATSEGKTGYALLIVAERLIQVTGRVIDGDTQMGVAAAGIAFGDSYSTNRHTATGGDGSFAFQLDDLGLGPQLVNAVASATGYVSTRHIQEVSGPSTQLETILLVRQSSSRGAISGTVRNARTNEGIGNATLTLYKGQGIPGPDSEVGPARRSDPEGGYTFTQLDAGTYTVQAAADGFSVGRRTAITVLSGAVVAQDVVLSPAGTNEIRIVLTWGSDPRDLDAHLTGPNSDASRFHIYYPPGSRGNLTSPPFALLDVDDTSSFGPETITITQLNSGVYRYSVHDFTNRASATSTALGTSGARVALYAPSFSLPKNFFVPSQRGTLWTVFELSGDIRNPTVTVRNEIGLAENPADIPITAHLPAKEALAP